MEDLLTPPAADRRPVTVTACNDDRTDDYSWLRDRESPDTTAYLEAENAYMKEAMAHTEGLQKTLYDEIVSRIKETDESVPVPWGGHWYYSRTVEGLQYGIQCRRSGSPEAPEQVLLDSNELAKGHDYFALGAWDVSPDHQLGIYSTDTDGHEIYRMRVRDLTTGLDLTDEIARTYYATAWASDNRTFFYTVPDESMRPWQLWRHVLGSAAGDDVLVYQEDDRRFGVTVHRSKTGAYVFLTVGSAITSEVRYLDAGVPDGEFRVFAPRRQGVEYYVDHQGERFLIRTNDDAPNFKLLEAPVGDPDSSNWQEVIPHRPDVKLDAVSSFAGHVVLTEKAEGLRRIRVMRIADGDVHTVEHAEEVYTAFPQSNPEYNTTTLRFSYQSMITPPSVFDYDMNERTRILLKEQPVLGGYDRTQYRTERVWATAGDGTRIPISVVYRAGRPRDGSAPLMLYGYGAYEVSIDPTFSSLLVSLLDRGFAFAIAHVRGGGEMGRLWYEAGKFLGKKNTFTDFIACAEHLVAERWTAPDRMVLRGGSAGGLLVGAVVNMRPDLFRAAVAEVPFVDTLSTMLDDTLPLTVPEWEEWGNPQQPEFYEYMKSYSPYDNVEAKAYPAMFVTAGLNDPRVAYWEPAKWVAKLRATKTDDNLLLLKTEMGAGHMGPSGRYDAWKDEALTYTFVLDQVGITE